LIARETNVWQIESGISLRCANSPWFYRAVNQGARDLQVLAAGRDVLVQTRVASGWDVLIDAGGGFAFQI